MIGNKSDTGDSAASGAGQSNRVKVKRGRPEKEPFAEVLRESEGYGGEGLLAVRAVGLAGRQPEMVSIRVRVLGASTRGVLFVSRKTGCKILRAVACCEMGFMNEEWGWVMKALPALIPSRKIVRRTLSGCGKMVVMEWSDFGVTLRGIDWRSAELVFHRIGGWSYSQVDHIKNESLVWEI